MKKFIAILLVVALAVTSVFAVDMSIGAEFGYGQHNFNMGKEMGDTDMTEFVVPVRADFLLGLEDLPLAFRFDLGTNIFKFTKADDVKIPSDSVKSVAAFNASAAVYYKYDATEDLSVLAGLGLGFDRYNMMKMQDVSGTEADGMKMNRSMLALYIDAQVRYEVVDHVELFGGVTLGGNVMDKIVMDGPGMEDVSKDLRTQKFEGTNFRWGVNVGAAYKF